MCNYSVEVDMRSRRARQGEVLRVRTIGDGVGFIGEDGDLICLAQGTELAFKARVRATCSKTDHPTVTTAKFRFLRAKRTQGNTYDVLDFADGKQLLMAWLKPRQSARVLQLPAKRKRRNDAKPRELVAARS